MQPLRSDTNTINSATGAPAENLSTTSIAAVARPPVLSIDSARAIDAARVHIRRQDLDFREPREISPEEFLSDYAASSCDTNPLSEGEQILHSSLPITSFGMEESITIFVLAQDKKGERQISAFHVSPTVLTSDIIHFFNQASPVDYQISVLFIGGNEISSKEGGSLAHTIYQSFNQCFGKENSIPLVGYFNFCDNRFISVHVDLGGEVVYYIHPIEQVAEGDFMQHYLQPDQILGESSMGIIASSVLPINTPRIANGIVIFSRGIDQDGNPFIAGLLVTNATSNEEILSFFSTTKSSVIEESTLQFSFIGKDPTFTPESEGILERKIDDMFITCFTEDSEIPIRRCLKVASDPDISANFDLDGLVTYCLHVGT